MINNDMKKFLKALNNFYLINKGSNEIEKSFGYFSKHIFSPINKERLRLIEKQVRIIDPDKNTKVIDIACGGGIISSMLAYKGYDVVGYDIDKNELNLAKKFSTFVKVEVKYVLGEARDTVKLDKLLCGDKKIVILGYALHHFSEVEKFVSYLSDKLPEGSVLIVNEEDPNRLLFKVKNYVRTVLQGDTEEESQRSYLAWKELLEDNSFTVNNEISIDWWGVKVWSFIFTAKVNK